MLDRPYEKRFRYVMPLRFESRLVMGRMQHPNKCPEVRKRGTHSGEIIYAEREAAVLNEAQKTLCISGRIFA